MSSEDAPTHRLLSLARLEWIYIRSVLTKCRGNKTKAAYILKINRRTLHRILKRSEPTR